MRRQRRQSDRTTWSVSRDKTAVTVRAYGKALTFHIGDTAAYDYVERPFVATVASISDKRVVFCNSEPMRPDSWQAKGMHVAMFAVLQRDAYLRH